MAPPGPGVGGESVEGRFDFQHTGGGWLAATSSSFVAATSSSMTCAPGPTMARARPGAEERGCTEHPPDDGPKAVDMAIQDPNRKSTTERGSLSSSTCAPSSSAARSTSGQEQSAALEQRPCSQARRDPCLDMETIQGGSGVGYSF